MDYTADEYALRDADRLREVLAGPPVTWVFVGDSITQGVTHTYGRRSFVEHFSERVRGELGRLTDAVVNSGVAGSVTDDLLREFHWRTGRFAPDVVFVMFGTNDMVAGPDNVRAFRYRLDQVVQRTRDLGSTVVLQTPPPVLPSTDRSPELLAPYVDAVWAVAHDLGVVLVDHFAHWASVAGGRAAPDGWLDDDIHPSALGHHELARTLFRALAIDDDASPVCALGVDEVVAATA